MTRICVSHAAGSNGVPVPENFRMENQSIPLDLKEGEVLIRTLFLSVDPYMVIENCQETFLD